MKKLLFFAAVLLLACVALPHRSPAPLVVKQGEEPTYVAPGAEEVPNQRDAQAQFDAAFEAENKGRLGTALNGYRKTVRRFPKSTVAASAQYKVGVLLEKQQNYTGSSEAYERLIVNYPHSTDFNNALEGEYRIGTQYLDGMRQKVLGVPTLPSRQRAVAIYGVIVRNAPFSRFAPMAQFNIGQAQQIDGDPAAAIAAYQIVVDKYPTDSIAADALYQIGFAYMTISNNGSNDRVAAKQARESFEDFLAAYPNHEKAAQAKENLASLTGKQSGGSLKIADYYYGQKQFRAAVVYYNDVIRQQANSPDGEKAKARLDQIRSKFGEKYFTDPAPATAANKAAGVTPKLGDNRLQAQTDTAKRPDYVGPPVSAPTPPPPPPSAPAPVVANPSGTNTSLPDNPNKPPPASRGEATPLPVPEGEQPSLPSQ